MINHVLVCDTCSSFVVFFFFFFFFFVFFCFFFSSIAMELHEDCIFG